MLRIQPTGAPVRSFRPPTGSQRVVRVFVNGVQQQPGVDFELLPGPVVRFAEARRPREHLTALGHVLAAAAWVGVDPGGDEITAEVRRDGRIAVVDLLPGDG